MYCEEHLAFINKPIIQILCKFFLPGNQISWQLIVKRDSSMIYSAPLSKIIYMVLFFFPNFHEIHEMAENVLPFEHEKVLII